MAGSIAFTQVERDEWLSYLLPMQSGVQVHGLQMPIFRSYYLIYLITLLRHTLYVLLPQLKQHKNFFTDLFKGMYPRGLPCQFHSIYHSYINAIMLAFFKIDNTQ